MKIYVVLETLWSEPDCGGHSYVTSRVGVVHMSKTKAEQACIPAYYDRETISKEVVERELQTWGED